MALPSVSLTSQARQTPISSMARQLARSRALMRSLVYWLASLALGVVVLGIWQLLAALRIAPAFVLPAPLAVAQAFRSAFADGTLISATASTLAESGLGFLLGIAVALPLGYVIAHSRVMARLLEPYLAMSQALPAVALAPLLVLWLGYGLLPIVTLCALIVFFPVTIGTILGLTTVDRDVLDAAAVDGATGWSRLWFIETPLALPSILTGIRAGLTYSITGAVVGEFVVSAQGLGGLLMIARGNFDTPLVFATLIALAVLAALMYGLGRLIELFTRYIDLEVR
jgi:NitT/TauT family transport system permease protein